MFQTVLNFFPAEAKADCINDNDCGSDEICTDDMNCETALCDPGAPCPGGRRCHQGICLKVGQTPNMVTVSDGLAIIGSDSDNSCACRLQVDGEGFRVDAATSVQVRYQFTLSQILNGKISSDITLPPAFSEARVLSDCNFNIRQSFVGSPVVNLLVSCMPKADKYDSSTAVPTTPTQGEEEAGLIIPDVSVLNTLGDIYLPELIGRVIKAAMGIMGSIALAMIVYGGVLWMTAGGNAEKGAKAMQIFIWSSLGIVLIFASYAVVDIVFEAFR